MISEEAKAHKLEYNKQYRKTHKGDLKNWITKTYGRMKRDNKNKFLSQLPFSKEEFKNWLQGTNIEILLQNYTNSNFNKNLNPSIDRIDDYKGYMFDNMQLITWEENNLKGRMGNKNKEQCSKMAKKTWSKKVAQLDSKGNTVNTFESTHDVERQLGIDSSSVAKVCRGAYKTYKGYGWKYV